jgi:hypothetical protein
MREILSIVAILIFTATMTEAQTTRIVFGPLEGDSAGVITAGPEEEIVVDVWARTPAGTNIVGLMLPLSSNDNYIMSESRVGGELFDPLTLWDDIDFPDYSMDPSNDGYTCQPIMGVKDFFQNPSPDNGINTDGEWWKIADYRMTTVDSADNEIHRDALTGGFYNCAGGMILVDYDSGEISGEYVSFSYAPLLLTSAVEVHGPSALPDVYALKQNHPNPFNAKTTIEFNLSDESDVVIEIFDIIGRKTTTLTDGVLPAGVHSLTWDAEDAPSGIYFYRIRAGKYIETKKAVLLK